jgi:hypothetical protein
MLSSHKKTLLRRLELDDEMDGDLSKQDFRNFNVSEDALCRFYSGRSSLMMDAHTKKQKFTLIPKSKYDSYKSATKEVNNIIDRCENFNEPTN